MALITRLDDAPEEVQLDGAHYGGAWKVLTPLMRERGGKLGVVWNRLPPGRVGCPFHTHELEDEVFWILEGEGVLRYGDEVVPIRAGDCISCPAGTGVAHQIANSSTRDLIYLAIGDHEPREVCTYPDSGKILVRSRREVGRLEVTHYMDGEPERPKVFEMIEKK